MESLPFTIVGGGICGVMTALKLKIKYPNTEVLLLDKEPYIGHHNTTRNSGVLHAGLYYPTGSQKHLLCRDGYEQWIKLSKTHEIPINICGKFVIATDNSETDYLDKIFSNALRNGVPLVREMNRDEMREISDYTHVVKGFYSPQTGILDISQAINTLRDELVRLGGIVMLKTEVVDLIYREQKILVKTATDEFLTDNLVNCAGPWAVTLRKKLNLLDIEDCFVKGNYLKLNKQYYNKRLIYPVPSKNLAGLGVHTSFHMDGIVRFGPNTETVTQVEYSNSPKNIDIMYSQINEKFKNISKTDLSLDYVGVRTKILRNGQPYSDFLIQGPTETNVPAYFEALGIESPGMTAAPAIADSLVRKIRNWIT